MWVPAPYKQTKNQTYATTEITGGSCYREVRWNWKVSTNGQNPTFSRLYARSQLRKWQWPSSSRCIAGHREGHPEKDTYFLKELAQGCWKLNRQAKLLVSRRHAFFTKICVSPAGRVCVYSSLILSTFFSSFFQLQYSCIFHCKAVLDCCVRCSNEVDIQSWRQRT